MNTIVERITEAIKDILINFIQSGMEDMFVEVNNKVGTIATQVGQTPQSWNGNVFSLIKSLSDTVMVPIAGLIITFVLCYELISMITQKNNFHEFETFNIFIWVFKAYVAIYLVTNTFNITMAVFDVGQHVVNSAAGVISSSAEIDATTAIGNLLDKMQDMEVGELFLLALETMLISMTMKILSVAITVILYGRMIEIYLTCSVAPIPFATILPYLYEYCGLVEKSPEIAAEVKETETGAVAHKDTQPVGIMEKRSVKSAGEKKKSIHDRLKENKKNLGQKLGKDDPQKGVELT